MGNYAIKGVNKNNGLTNTIKPVKNEDFNAENPVTSLANKDRDKFINIYDNHMNFADNKNKENITFWDKDKNGAYDEIEIVIDNNKHEQYSINEKENNVTNVQDEQIAMLNMNEKEYLKARFKVNGKIDAFAQGKTGDCWLLAGLKAVSGTKNGANIIKDSISQDKDGNVTVKLKGVNETYTFSLDDIKNAQGKKAFGDADVIAFELAFEEHRKMVLQNPEKYDFTKEKYRVGDKDTSDILKGGFAFEAFTILTDKYVTSFFSEKNGAEKQNAKLADMGLALKKHFPEKIAICVSFINEQENMLDGHTYSVEKADDKYVTLSNPYDALKPIKIKNDKFLNNCDSMCIVNVEGQ